MFIKTISFFKAVSLLIGGIKFGVRLHYVGGAESLYAKKPQEVGISL